VVEIDGSGTRVKVTGKAVGTETITVSSGTKKAQCAVEVSANRTGVSLKDTFGIVETGTGGVYKTFSAVHEYLQTNPTPTTGTRDGYTVITKIGVIGLGDYIDLESLSIAGYPVDDTGYGKLTDVANTDLGNGRGYLLRLMVVGINSFNGKNDNGEFPHLVFQFQNPPGLYWMNSSETNEGGYAASEGRAYLVSVSGKSGSGAFQTGLTNAGVPFNVSWIFAPRRYVANGGYYGTSADLIRDKLWLPTEREVCDQAYSHPRYETPDNQVRLGYYTSNGYRLKYLPAKASFWWTASSVAASTTNFCRVTEYGKAGYVAANNSSGFAPAFCVN
jgi:hypothetical protein